MTTRLDRGDECARCPAFKVASDAMLRGYRRMARDEADDPGTTANIRTVLRKLAHACNEQEWAEFRRLLIGETDDDDAALDCTSDLPGTQTANGMPRSGLVAQDAATRARAESAFATRFPGAALIKDFGGTTPTPRRKSPDEQAMQDFYKRFPDAARVGRSW